MPNSSPQPFVHQGAFDASAVADLQSCIERTLVSNTTVVQNTNPTAATNMMTASLQPGTLSRVGQTLQIFAAGIVNLTTTTSAATFAAVLNGVTLATFTTGNYAVGAINLSWNMNLLATVVSVDSTGSAVCECHGQVSGSLTTLAGAVTSYNDSNVAVLSTIPTGGGLLAITGFLAAGNAASFINQRQLVVDLYN